MLNDRSQWRIEELRAKERAEAKRRERVKERTKEIRASADRLIDIVTECAPEIAKILSKHPDPHRALSVVWLAANEIAEREIPPVSLQDIADELVGEVSHEIE